MQIFLNFVHPDESTIDGYWINNRWL